MEQVVVMDNNEFKKLQKEWYAKLAKTGFKDIEDTTKEDPPLKVWDSTYFANPEVKARQEATLNYYNLASDMLNWYEFRSAIDRTIWTMHSEGSSIRKIAKSTNKTYYLVQKTIARIRKDVHRILGV